MASSRRRVPKIELSRIEKLCYDSLVADVLRECLAQYAQHHGVVDTDDWTLVRKQKQMSVFRSKEHSSASALTVMAGTGLISGTLEDVMDGLYCDTSSDIRTATTLLKHKVVDGAVLQIGERRAPDAPFRFAGIKWLAVKAPWGIAKNRDLLTYERMGTTMDADGNELAFHVLQSIERPEWPAGCVKGIKREHTSTCYLYRRHSTNRVQCFLWGEVQDLGSMGRRLAEYFVTGSWLKVVNTAECADAKKRSKLMARSNERVWFPTNNECVVCTKPPGIFESQRQCAGCKKNVCKSCSAKHAVFQLDRRTGKLHEERFCKLCSNKVATTAGTLSPPRERIALDPIGRARGKTLRNMSSKSSIATPQATVASSFQTDDDSGDEDSQFVKELAAIRLRSSFGFESEGDEELDDDDDDDNQATFGRESFRIPSDTADMVWMPDPSLNDSRSSVLILLSEKLSDQQHPLHRRHSIDSARSLTSQRCSVTSVRSSDDIWSTGGLGHFDLGVSQCPDEDNVLARSIKHLPTRQSHHTQYARSLRPRDWETFVTDLYVQTPRTSDLQSQLSSTGGSNSRIRMSLMSGPHEWV